MKIKIRSYLKYILTAVLFYLLFSSGTICYADADAKVLEDIAIRAEADSSSKQVGTLEEGQTVLIIRQVTGTDSNIWFQIRNGAIIGYIRSDYVKVTDFDGELYVSDPIIGGVWKEQTEKLPVIPTPVVTKEEPDMLPGFALHDWNDIEGTYYQNGDFYIYYGQILNYEPAWYMVDISERTVQRYVLTAEYDTLIPKSKEIPKPLPTDEDEIPYIIKGFKPSKFAESAEVICYKNDDFMIYYGQAANSDPDWYMVDIKNQTAQRYLYAAEGVAVDPENKLLLPMIGVAIVVLIMIPAFFIFVRTEK